jgi:DNA processing protein
MKKSAEQCLILALSVQRISYLRPDEKLLLWDLVDDELSLSLLLYRDVEAAIGRSLGGRPWSPDSFLEAALRDARFLERSGCRFIHYDENAYPSSLRETCRPPFGLFARGADLDPAADRVAVVGTRLPTGKAMTVAFDLARGLSAAGVDVVSGLARGIDAAAHRGALSARPTADSMVLRGVASVPGATCAVLPCGIDRVYPPSNRRLAAEILDRGGLLLSEYPPGEEIRKYRFPERNRIIAGMARSCVVVEAPAKSGALITADHALDEGRDVWVPAACLGGSRSAGADKLAADGARVLIEAGDIIDDWTGAGSGARVVPRATGGERLQRRGTRSDRVGEGGRPISTAGDELAFGEASVKH